jgi:hypothetical protein
MTLWANGTISILRRLRRRPSATQTVLGPPDHAQSAQLPSVHLAWATGARQGDQMAESPHTLEISRETSERNME